MDFCFKCGGKTDPDWVFCRACGGVLEDTELDDLTAPVSTATGAPKVELISRGWDVVDVDTVDLPVDPLEGNYVAADPLSPGAIEISAGDITVVEATEPVDTDASFAVTDDKGPAIPTPVDPWDHLRPHGELPPRQHHVSLTARIGQSMVVLTAVAALAAAVVHFYLNTRLDAFVKGAISISAVDDVELVADISLAVVAGLIVLAAMPLVWWLIGARSTSDFRPGKAGMVALLSLVAGVGVVAASFVVKKDTVTEAIAANSLIVLGLALVITAALATVRTVQRIALKEPA